MLRVGEAGAHFFGTRENVCVGAIESVSCSGLATFDLHLSSTLICYFSPCARFPLAMLGFAVSVPLDETRLGHTSNDASRRQVPVSNLMHANKMDVFLSTCSHGRHVQFCDLKPRCEMKLSA